MIQGDLNMRETQYEGIIIFLFYIYCTVYTCI